MPPGSDPLLRHIRHAEEWLGRARVDWRRGNAPAAMLRLMLAEAEIRHARESGMDAQAAAAHAAPLPADRRVAWPKAAAVIAAAAVLAAGLGYAAMRPGAAPEDDLAVRVPAAGVGGGLSRTIVRLDSGQFLMPDGERTAGSGPVSPGSTAGDTRPLQFAVPVDLKTPSPTF